MKSSARRVLISEENIANRVRELGNLINRHYSGRRPVFLGIMNGALFFLTDLLRATDLETEISCVRLSSYAGTTSTGRVSGVDGLQESVEGREVLIVDDIFDTGRTLAVIVNRLKDLGAAEVKVCVLLEKLRAHMTPIRPDWVGFEIEDAFVVGYGLDFNGQYRCLSNIEVLAEPETSLTPVAETLGIALTSARG